MSQAKLVFVEKQDGQLAPNQKQTRKCGCKPCSVEAAVFKEFLILVPTCTVVAGSLVLKRGLQVWFGASFDGKQLFAAPSCQSHWHFWPSRRVSIVPQVTATIAHRGLAGKC